MWLGAFPLFSHHPEQGSPPAIGRPKPLSPASLMESRFTLTLGCFDDVSPQSARKKADESIQLSAVSQQVKAGKPSQPPPCVSAPATRASQVVAQDLPEAWLLGNPSVRLDHTSTWSLSVPALLPRALTHGGRELPPTSPPARPLLLRGRIISVPCARHTPSPHGHTPFWSSVGLGVVLLGLARAVYGPGEHSPKRKARRSPVSPCEKPGSSAGRHGEVGRVLWSPTG